MYYVGAMNFMFVYTILGYSISIFLMERFPEYPNAIFLVGLILGMASVFGIFIDAFFSYLQKLFQPRKLLLTAIIGLIITVSIFFASHYVAILQWSLFTVMAAFFYGWSYDLYEVTMSTVIFDRSKKEEYAQSISEKKVAEALGMLLGIIMSGGTLYFGSEVAQVFLLIFLTVIFFFFKSHFDQEADNIALKFSEKSGIPWREIFSSLANPEFVKEKLHSAEEGLKEQILALSYATAEEMKHLPQTAQNFSKASKSVLESARLTLIDILAKEDEIIRERVPESPFHAKEMIHEVQGAFRAFFQIFQSGTSFALVWVTVIIIFFSFWDTMAVTFQPLFFQTFQGEFGFLSSFFMLFFVLPVFVFQLPFAHLADKYGRHLLIVIGIFLSSVSLLFLGLSDTLFERNIWVILLAGVGNALGYAAAFSPAQAKFADALEQSAKAKGQILKSSEMAAPLRITLNIGNILGQIAGGLIFSFLGFFSGFFMFGVLLLAVSVLSLLFYSKIKGV